MIILEGGTHPQGTVHYQVEQRLRKTATRTRDLHSERTYYGSSRSMLMALLLRVQRTRTASPSMSVS